MPHFSLMAQPSHRVVEGMEKHPASLEESLTGASASQETSRQTPCVVHPHLSSLLCIILEEAASPGGLWELSREWRDESLTSCSICFLLQDYIFYLEPDKLESGKGKCSYDPKVDTVSALISESCGSLVPVLSVLGGGNMQVEWNNCSHQEQNSRSTTPARKLAQQRWGSWLQTSANFQNSLGWSQAVALGCLVATSQVWGWQLKKVGGWCEVEIPG